MHVIIRIAALFLARILDNLLSTAKAIMIQKGRGKAAGITVVISNFLYFAVMKEVMQTDSMTAVTAVAAAGGIGCWLAVQISDRFSRDRTFIHVILSDDRKAMEEFRDFLAAAHITNVASDCYTRDWSRKTLSLTVYAETKEESRQIDGYISESPLKCKRYIYSMQEGGSAYAGDHRSRTEGDGSKSDM